MRRRALLQAMAGLPISLATTRALGAPLTLRGLFPIAQTPFTAENQLDLQALVQQVSFCSHHGVPGLIWPQLASNWSTLSEEERLRGAKRFWRRLKARLST